MYNEVLRYGSFIVDTFVDFKQPIFTYIPPTDELRGGSWVVVEPTINADTMLMLNPELVFGHQKVWLVLNTHENH